MCRLYPDPYCRSLRNTLAAVNHTNADEVLVDAGADSLICLVLRTRVTPDDSVITTAGTYPTFKYFAEGCGANVIEVGNLSFLVTNKFSVDLCSFRNAMTCFVPLQIPYKDDPETRQISVDLAALGEAARIHDASVVYVANPDNPSGHVHTASDIGEKV